MRFRVAGLILPLALGILSAPLAPDARQPKKIPRIGVLTLLSPSSGPLLDPFRQGLRELGYVEGRNIALEYRWAAGSTDLLPDLAAALVRLKVDVIVASSTPVAQAAKKATRTIPIVMVNVRDPVENGLVASLARPGGNITGIAFIPSLDISGKQLELLKEAAPGVSRVAVLWNPANPGHGLALKQIEVAAQAWGVQLQSLEVRGLIDFESAFSVMRRERSGALLTLLDPLTFIHRTRIADFAATNLLPTMYEVREFVDAGGLMSYGPSLPDFFRRAATFVDKILKGAKPADLPVEQPMKFELVINLKTAKALGLTVPQSVLIRADDVIQ